MTWKSYSDWCDDIVLFVWLPGRCYEVFWFFSIVLHLIFNVVFVSLNNKTIFLTNLIQTFKMKY